MVREGGGGLEGTDPHEEINKLSNDSFFLFV